MADTVHCDKHGETEQTFVCTHLAGDAVGLGFNLEEPDSDNPFPDAWCDSCEIIRAAHGGWTDEAQSLCKIALLCARCYERTRIRNTRPSVTLDDLAAMRWKCGSCDEWHTGPDLDFAYDHPDYLENGNDTSTRWSVLPSGAIEKPSNSFLDAEYCAINDEDLFVRGLIRLPIVGTGETFCWGVWGSLSRMNFEALLKADQTGERVELPPMFSWLSNWISDYPDTRNLKMHAHIQEPGMRPHFELEAADHPLSQEYHHGITPERIKEIMLKRLPANKQ